MHFLTFIFAQDTDFVQKQVSFIEQTLPEWPEPKLFIGIINDTEWYEPVTNKKTH